ncbi:Stk1 family PASTA domain-containing Ser/Thr kinase [Roseburia sp. TF10-5]|uniref:Stk1 family PASTA domain-containing Ser/Thr kinase n=1 Tax=Roseburia sp. TF10-5 TaxID=2293144 RepID=UPI000E500FFC|nr:Stk1 family PASTA domain-containing Ser/Thr kinase [Roseburia sp. TF10-5]RGI13932.1 Stk1 family PASTA domain-containing Ser/Thr kinase [Roseburia sp. TF10-5]
MLTVGTYLADRYEIVSKIGAGGMSDVYKAKDHVLGRFVAIKVLKPEFSEDRGFVAKFRTEAQSAAGLEHPNIVNIYDVGSEEGLHYIVMEYVEGITLKTYIEKKGQLSFKEAVSIAIQVARGIEAAHNKQIIHRDIKPQNIMISTEGKVKVMDFGIARAASSNTVSSDVMGSVHYSSPEQARNGFVDGRSDIYSLGIVMYEMVTGRVPFDGDTTVAVAIQHLQEEMTPPSVYAKNLPISMEKIILKCTQKNADRRYQTIGDLLADLRRSLVHPDEDFVVIAPLVDNGKTKVISGEELKQIKEHGGEPKEDRHASKLESSYDPDEDEDDEDEDENEGLSPKMDKAMTIMGIVVFVVILAVIIYLVGSFFGLFRFGSNSSKNTETQTQTQTQTQTESEQPVVVQNVCGKLQEEAQSELEAQGLYMFVIQEQKSDQPEGTVLNQDPVGGSEVSAGTTINVIVAGTENVDFTDSESQSGQNEVPVPNVVGKLEKDASSTLSAAGFKVSKTYKYDDSVDAGKVVSQSPRGGNAQEGSTVTIVISQGKKSSTVPSVQGHSKKDAQADLQKAGLKVAVKEEYSDSVKAGQVISQSVASGKIVPADTTVTITVSKGPEEINYSYKFSKSYAAPEGAVSATYTLTGSDGTTYASGTSDVDGSLTIGASDMACESGKVTITWSIEKIDDEGLSDTSTKTETHSVSFSKQ